MDQVKIGNFIATLRKEKKMTQKELAETIGVSDKAISKWENGKGMPELSMLMPLCQVLQINVNELLSGERLSDDSFSMKAEENIMNLIREKEENRKQTKRDTLGAVLVLGLTLCAMVIAVEWTLVTNFGLSGIYETRNYLFDLASLVPILITTVLALCATRLWKPFFRGFGIVFWHREYSLYEVKESALALRLAGNMWILTGLLVTCINVIAVGWSAGEMALGEKVDFGAFMISIGICFLGVLYGMIGRLLLLPVQGRLEIIAEKLLGQV